VTKIHVQSNRLNVRYFLSDVLPYFENRYATTGEQIIIQLGSGDHSVGQQEGLRMLGSPAVLKVILENNLVKEISDHPKTTMMPNGVCYREINKNLFLHDFQTAQNESLLVPWESRKNKIFFCFGNHGSIGNRRAVYYNFAAEHCDPEFCERCNIADDHVPHLDLWRNYTAYKFVFAPLGNGPDCGRNWEILSMGAIPIIDFYEVICIVYS